MLRALFEYADLYQPATPRKNTYCHTLELTVDFDHFWQIKLGTINDVRATLWIRHWVRVLLGIGIDQKSF
jgi:hypothetical protein